jgi:hypothetical protein
MEVNSTYSSSRGLPGARSTATRAAVFFVECERHDIVAVAGEEALPLVDCIHDDAYSSDVVPARALRHTPMLQQGFGGLRDECGGSEMIGNWWHM